MSVILRCELEQTLPASLIDPGGAFWPDQVRTWIARRRQSNVFDLVGDARITTFPNRAIVYLSAPNTPTGSQLETLRAGWTKEGSWAVKVNSVSVVSAPNPKDDDLNAIDPIRRTVTQPAAKAAKTAATVLTAVVVIGAVAVAAYAYDKGLLKGTLSWRD